jgi:hypothetical protein
MGFPGSPAHFALNLIGSSMTDGAQDRPLDSTTSRTSPAWLNLVAPIVSGAALYVLSFLGLIVVVNHFGFEPRLRNLLVFAVSVSALPAACAAIQQVADRLAPRAASRLFESINVWCAVAALLVLAFVAVATWRSGGIDFWQHNALQAARAVLGLYLVLLAIVVGLGVWLGLGPRLAPGYPKPAYLVRAEIAVLHFDMRSAQTIAFTYAFVVAIIALFRIEPANRHYNGLFSIFFPVKLGGFPSSSQVIVAALLAISAIVIPVLILLAERRLERRDPDLLLRIQKLALPLAGVAAAVFFFDFSLSADTLHYLTNVGPALHLLGGGTLMVNTFSQYGPGPVLLEYLAFQFGMPSFGAANIAVQLCNILFYILFLVALWQSTRHRLAALWLGLLVLTFWLSGWSYGDGNVNAAPSVLGARYLPPMLMAVALGAGAEGKRHSVPTFLASFLAACWSVEAVAGVIALHCGFLALLNLRDRSFGRLIVDVALACLPIVIGLTTMSLCTWLASGKLPAFAIYLGFFGSYNPMATYWAVPFDGLFWGWIPMLLAIMIVLGSCCQTAIFGRQGKLPPRTDYWQRHCLPAALLTTLTAAYFAGRAVDYVILIALLPFSLLLIPASLWLVNVAANRNWVAASLSAIPLIAFLWMSSFSLLYLYRVGSPYSLVVQECRDHGRCTPAALRQGLSDTLRRQLTFEPGTDVWSMNPYDQGIAVDTKHLIDRFAANDAEVTVLLGENGDGNPLLSDIALMYAGKWHTWPRSFTFTDELVPALVARILATPVTLRTGNVVILRRDESNLGFLESSILKLIRSTGSLCALEGSTTELAPYRFWKNGDPKPAGGCMNRPDDDPPNMSEAEKEMLQALPVFIGDIQRASDTLPDGVIDRRTLRGARVEIPSQLVRGERLASFWGDVAINKYGKSLTLDLARTRHSVCLILLMGASQMPGVVRVATSATLADERNAPVTEEQASQACTRHPGFIRLILDTRP